MLLELLRLRLTALSLGGRVEAVELEAETSEPLPGQLAMFVQKRDLAAGDRAFARLKASFGADVVCTAELEDAHLPEAKFRWVPLDHLVRPSVHESESDMAAPLVRRLLARPELLAGALDENASRLDKVFVHESERYTLVGPYRVSGGWWAREVTRDYYYARTPRGELWWVFYDHPRRSWFLHAIVD
jgi:protein ImuB